MATITGPILAATLKPEDINKLKFPVLATTKLDGIRCLFINGEAKSRTFKSIPNTYIKTELEKIFNFGTNKIFDGEILSGLTFQSCSSNIMRFEGEPTFKYYLFDYISEDLAEPYEDRMKKLEGLPITDPRIIKLLPTIINNAEELEAFEIKSLADGFEGVILRSPKGPYKCGRSTNKEGYLLKLKRFSDSEAKIIGFEELEHNLNEKTTNELGHSKRATCQENKIGGNTLGTLLVRDIHTNLEFRIGTGKGLDQALRQKIWDNQNEYMGQIVKYKYFSIGQKDLPRHPVALGFRHSEDL